MNYGSIFSPKWLTRLVVLIFPDIASLLKQNVAYVTDTKPNGTAGNLLSGNGSISETWVALEELTRQEVTTKFNSI